MRARATCTRLRSPSLRVPKVRSARCSAPDLREQVGGPVVVEVGVLLAPAAQDAVGRGDDDVLDQLGARDPVGERGAGEADARAQLEDVGRAEHLVEDPGHARGRVHLRGGDLEQRRLAGAVGPEDHPALVLLDQPADVVEQQRLAPAHRDPCELDDGDHARHPIQHRPRLGPGHGGAGRRVASPAMSRTHLALPHSANLAWWLTAWLRGHEQTDHVLDALADDDPPAGGRLRRSTCWCARGAPVRRTPDWRCPSTATRWAWAARATSTARRSRPAQAVVVGDLGLVPEEQGETVQWQAPGGVTPPAAGRRRGRPHPARRAPRRGGATWPTSTWRGGDPRPPTR